MAYRSGPPVLRNGRHEPGVCPASDTLTVELSTVTARAPWP